MSDKLSPTAERAASLAKAAAQFPILGEITAEDLLTVVKLELGHAEILDGLRPHGRHLARAIAPGTILHVVSGNTPHAALQSLLCGLLLGSHNLVKIPSVGLPEVAEFVAALPAELAARVEISPTLPDPWLRAARAVIVFGNDETIAHFRARVPAIVPFQAHGHRVSAGLVFSDAGYASVPAAAKDVSLYDQRGCLSPHDIYVATAPGLQPRTYAARLAEAMADFNLHTPRSPLSMGEHAAIADLRASYAFRSASDPRVQLWTSGDSTDWTVIYEDDPWFATSPLNRVVFVKPLPSTPEGIAGALAPVQSWLGAIGIWPATVENAESVASLGASRICPLGRMQFPPVTWHAEGLPNLGSLVRWVDFEPAA
jgi:hypothetical protein